MLDGEALAELADLVRASPAEGKYAAVLSCLWDSADQQLYTDQHLLTQLELGDKKPSRLLRGMRALVRDKVSKVPAYVSGVDEP